MSISEIIVKGVGVILAIFGLIIIIGSVTGLPGSWIIVVAGVFCIIIGVYIVRGGHFVP